LGAVEFHARLCEPLDLLLEGFFLLLYNGIQRNHGFSLLPPRSEVRGKFVTQLSPEVDRVIFQLFKLGHGGTLQRQDEQFAFHFGPCQGVVEDDVYVIHMFVRIRGVVVSLHLGRLCKNARDRILCYLPGERTHDVALVMALWRIVFLPLTTSARGKVFTYLAIRRFTGRRVTTFSSI
jgi:hypothetical protein